MRLAAKLVLLFLFGLLLIVGLFSYLTIQQDRRLAIAEHQRYAADLAATLQASLGDAMHHHDHHQLQQVFQQTTQQVRHVQVRLVELRSGGGDSPQLPAVPLDMIVTDRRITTISMPNSAGQPTLYTYVPLATATTTNPNDATAGIEIAAPDLESTNRWRHSLLSSLLALMGVAALSGAVITVGGLTMVGKPLNQLIDKVHRVGQGDFSGPVQVHSQDELGRLGAALNQMCEQLDRQRRQIDAESESRIAAVRQLRHADRLNTVGRLAAGIAHEIGTPLNVVSGRAEMIASGQLPAPAVRESALAIQSEAQRITRTVRQLLDFARQNSPHRSPQVLGDLIRETVNMTDTLASKRQIELALELPDQPQVAAIDAAQIQQVLTNLIVNAIHSIDGEGGKIQIQLSSDVIDHPRGPFHKISVRDNGSGISPADQEHVFEPFFTRKDVGEGTGLGLSIAHGIIHEHGGWIEVDSKLGEGSCFTIYLPTTNGDGEKGSDE